MIERWSRVRAQVHRFVSRAVRPVATTRHSRASQTRARNTFTTVKRHASIHSPVQLCDAAHRIRPRTSRPHTQTQSPIVQSQRHALRRRQARPLKLHRPVLSCPASPQVVLSLTARQSLCRAAQAPRWSLRPMLGRAKYFLLRANTWKGKGASNNTYGPSMLTYCNRMAPIRAADVPVVPELSRVSFFRPP